MRSLFSAVPTVAAVTVLLLLLLVVSDAAAAAADNINRDVEQEQQVVVELGVTNFASTVKRKLWTCVLFYDGNGVKGRADLQALMDGLTTTLHANSNVSVAQLDVRRHPYYREAYEYPDDPSPLIKDYYDEFPDDAENPLVVSHKTFMNWQVNLYFPSQLLLMGHDFNVYGQLDLATLTANVGMKVSIVTRWIQESTLGKMPEQMDVGVASQIHTEQERALQARDLDNTFPFHKFNPKKMSTEKERSLLQLESSGQGSSVGGSEASNTTVQQPHKQSKMTIHSRGDNSPNWLDALSHIIKSYLVWVEGYEVLWDDERKAREDQQTHFGTHLQDLNKKVRLLINTIFGGAEGGEAYVPPTKSFDNENSAASTLSEEARRINQEAETKKSMIPHALKGYFEELVFGVGRSPATLQKYLENTVRFSLGATPEERRINAKQQEQQDASQNQLVLFQNMREYMRVVEETNRDPDLYAYALADLTSQWNNLLVQFQDNLHDSYAQYLQQHPRDHPHALFAQRTTIEVVNMDDPSNYNLLTDYNAFHEKYTKTATPVLLGHVNMTTEEYTLEYLVQQCGSMDVTSKVVESNPVGQQYGSSWGGLNDYVLPNELLNSQRLPKKKKRRRDSSDSDEDSSDDDSSDDDDDDEDFNFVDRSLTLQQFIALQKHVDNIYLHDYSLSRNCGSILYNETLYDNPEQQKFRIPSIVASYDLFHRLPLYGFANTWPSLFIGKKGSNSKIHVDSGASGFFMYLVSGRKRWMVAKPSERPYLYPLLQNVGSMAPDVLGMDKSDAANAFLSQRFPLLHRSTEEGDMYEVIQEPGQLIYIPPDCPHAVENLDDIVGIALNLSPRDAFARHLHDQIHFEREFGYTELALKYWLFEDNADQPIFGNTDPLYMTFAEYKGQF